MSEAVIFEVDYPLGDWWTCARPIVVGVHTTEAFYSLHYRHGGHYMGSLMQRCRRVNPIFYERCLSCGTPRDSLDRLGRALEGERQ